MLTAQIALRLFAYSLAFVATVQMGEAMMCFAYLILAIETLLHACFRH